MIVLNRISEATCFSKYGVGGSNLSEGTWHIQGIPGIAMIFHKNNVEIKLSEISTGGGQGTCGSQSVRGIVSPLLHLLAPAQII